MKKYLLVFAFVLSFCFSTMAQSDVVFGIQISPSFSWVNSDQRFANGNGSNIGLRLGIFGEFYFKENYAVTSGLGFAFGQGGAVLYDNGGVFFTQTEDSNLANQLIEVPTNLNYRIQYVEIPIGLKLRTREFGHFKWFAHPLMALGFKAKAIGDIEASGIPSEEDLNIKKDVNSLALHWGIGGGGEYSISSTTTAVFGLYFMNNFADINDDKGQIINQDGIQKENDEKLSGYSLTLFLGVRF